MQIKVDKLIGDDRATVYTGSLSGYENGAFSGFDFTDVGYLAIFEWGNNSNVETTYIMSIENDTDIKTNLVKDANTETEISKAVSHSLSNNIQCDVNLMYDNEYYERILLNNRELNIPLRITNNGTQQETVACYVAEYDSTGKMLGAVSSTALDVNSNQSVAVNINKICSSEAEALKIFIWDGETITPITKAINLTSADEDYYADSINDAQEYDISYPINGRINTGSDNDYIKFIPETSGDYTFNCISASNVLTTLYNANKSTLKSNLTSYKYRLTAGQTYYLKMMGNVGEYVLSVQYNVPSEAENFNIYEFDIDTNIYKKSIKETCEELYYSNRSLSKQMYDEYETILGDDAKLHRLPEFLSEHPKNLSNFDTLLNQYYGTRYSEFAAIKQRYIDLIDKYAELANNESTSAVELDGGMIAEDADKSKISNEGDNELYPIIGKYTPSAKKRENIEAENIGGGNKIQAIVTPAFTIVSTTATSITYKATFPVSRQWGNIIDIVDFNTNDGLTVAKNQYGTDEYRPSGQYTISGLKPGGIYILSMLWSTDGEWFGGDNSICRFVQLPDNTSENLTLYTGGRVTARLEAADKALASSSDFNTWLSRMDKAYNAYKELTGYIPYNSKKIEMRSTRDNLNDYMGITDGHNYWTVIFGYYTGGSTVFNHAKAFYQGHMRRLSKGDWGDTPMHELSHVFDNYKWNFDAETLAQLKLYYVIEQLNAKVYRPERYDNDSAGWYTKSNYHDLLKHDRYLDSYDDSFGNGTYASEGFASILIDIQKNIGWEPFKKTFRYFSSLSSGKVPLYDGDKLTLFLTKLKDYSGKDILSYISSRDKRIIESYFGVDLEYVEPIYPSLSTGGGSHSEINVDRGNYTTYEFTPFASGNYYIYTSPYGGSGVSNDTYLEVYTNSSLSGTPIASNDDYDGGRFSKVSIAATAGTTYYIKVRHYASGQLHADLNITKDAPVQLLTIDGYQDIITANGEYALFSFTPNITSAYSFEANTYNGNNYDTYIKLYENASMTKRVGYDAKKILANLKAGHTYYLQFSGYLMKYARGRITVTKGQTLEFRKNNNGSFLYVNNPEKFIDDDIIQAVTANHDTNNLIYRQTNVKETNTLYVTHSCSDYENHPTSEFYYDVDFENTTNSSITISIDKLNYLVTQSYGDLPKLCYDRLSDRSEYNDTYTIPGNSHVLLFKDILGQSLKMPVRSDNYYCLLGIFLDFKVLDNKSLTVNTLAAYDEKYLKLTTSSNGKIYADTNTEISNWNFATFSDEKRLGETDINQKMKGIDRSGLPEIKAEMSFAIDDSMPVQTLPFNMVDEFYGDDIYNPRYTWITCINPLNDIDWGLYKTSPSAMNGFEYEDKYIGKTGKWYFDFMHLNPNVYLYTNSSRYAKSLSGDELNNSINNTFINYFKHQASIDRPVNPLKDYPLPNGVSKEQWQNVAMMMGEWGVTYTYDIYANNNGSKNRNLKYMFSMANYVAVKLTVENLTTGEKESSLRTVESDKVNDEYIRQDHTLFDVNLKSNDKYHITISILNGVGTTGFDNWLELN